MPNLFFDDSLEAFVAVIIRVLGEGDLERGVILRDATGRLGYVSSANSASEKSRIEYEKYLRDALGDYARVDSVLLFSEDPGAKRLLTDPNKLVVAYKGRYFHLIDRRIVGSGWLQPPSDIVPEPLRFVFASLKGGVGRSTAIAVAASDLAARGRNVLVVDLDLEAPGLGELMLTPERAPRYGVVDYLVENGIGGVPQTYLEEFVGTSPLTQSEGGRVDVVPALGTRSSESPQNILPKLARAMIEDVAADGKSLSVSNQISRMIDKLVQRSSYDVVLIDSRAGLAELAAPAVLGLGAIVLLFGTAQSQTIAGYRAMFSGLKLLAMRDLGRGISADWRLLFRPVYAKASLDRQIGERYAADIYDLFAENLYDKDVGDDATQQLINYSADDRDAPHQPLIIPFDPRFVDFDPTRNTSHLAQSFYEQTYRPFLTELDNLILAFSSMEADIPERKT
jgi:hypothetical protein